MKKVSLIIPCYNCENYIEKLIISILNQTYKSLEVIFVNDGSTDNTEIIIKSYEKLFKEKQIEFKYFKKQNGGQASALNYGLKVFSGVYLCWPDSDDFFLKVDSIKNRVNFLEQNKKYSMVRCNAHVCYEDNISQPVGQLASELANNFRENLFDDFILQNKVWYAPISFLIKSKVFLDVYPERKIFASKGSGSQNLQMLVPISLNNKWGYLKEKDSVYTIRKNSYSRQWDTENKLLTRYFYHEEILRAVINNKNLDIDYEFYEKLIKIKYIKKRMDVAIKFGNKTLLKDEFYKLKNITTPNKYDIKKYIIGYIPFIKKIVEIIVGIKVYLKKMKYKKFFLKNELIKIHLQEKI